MALSALAFAQEAAGHAAEAAGHAADGHGGGGGAFPPFDPSLFPSQLFWFVLSFGVLFLIMNYLALPKVGAVLARREGTLKADREGAQQSTSAAEDAKAAMEKAIAKARADARTLIDEMRAKTQAELNAEQAEAEGRIAARVQEAEAKIDAARQKALAEVGTIANALAQDVADKLAPAPALQNAAGE